MTKKQKCPVITVGSNSNQEKVSAFWVVGSDGRSRCLQYLSSQCELSGKECPFGGEKTFEIAFRWENIFAEKGYIGGLHSRGVPRTRSRVWL